MPNAFNRATHRLARYEVGDERSGRPRYATAGLSPESRIALDGRSPIEGSAITSAIRAGGRPLSRSLGSPLLPRGPARLVLARSTSPRRAPGVAVESIAEAENWAQIVSHPLAVRENASHHEALRNGTKPVVTYLRRSAAMSACYPGAPSDGDGNTSSRAAWSRWRPVTGHRVKASRGCA
jgi:hypothetical protein